MSKAMTLTDEQRAVLLAHAMNLRAAAAALGVSRSTMRAAVNRDPVFAEKFERAREAAKPKPAPKPPPTPPPPRDERPIERPSDVERALAVAASIAASELPGRGSDHRGARTALPSDFADWRTRFHALGDDQRRGLLFELLKQEGERLRRDAAASWAPSPRHAHHDALPDAEVAAARAGKRGAA